MAGAEGSGPMQNMSVNDVLLSVTSEGVGKCKHSTLTASQCFSVVSVVVSWGARNLKCPVQHDSPISILICFGGQ